MTDNPNIVLRKARHEDREKVIEVESKSTPNLSYLPSVFDMFVSDEIGEFSVAEVDGEIVACGKYTVVPDGSIWLETLRVIPERQGIGIGKRFYERWFDIAHRQDVKTMRMYTGVRNVVSRGLAERYGLRLAEKFRGTYLSCQSDVAQRSVSAFQRVTDPERSTELLMTQSEEWGGFLVMNRTFYALTPALCDDLMQKGMVYEDPSSGSVIVMGARFMPEQAIHIGQFSGDAEACLGFAKEKGLERGVERLSCLFPSSKSNIQQTLTLYDFQLEQSDFIVMEIRLDN